MGVGVGHIIRSFKAYFSMKKRVGYTVTILISVVKKIINLPITAAGAAFSSYEKTRLYTYFLVVPNLFQFNNILFYLPPRNLLHSIIPEND